MMRGIILGRFFSAKDDDKTWIQSVSGLTEDKVTQIVNDCISWWKEVFQITKVLEQ